jgi:hypothetical protein
MRDGATQSASSLSAEPASEPETESEESTDAADDDEEEFDIADAESTDETETN